MDRPTTVTIAVIPSLQCVKPAREGKEKHPHRTRRDRIFHAVPKSEAIPFSIPPKPRSRAPPIQSDIRTRVFGEANTSRQNCIAITLGR